MTICRASTETWGKIVIGIAIAGLIAGQAVVPVSAHSTSGQSGSAGDQIVDGTLPGNTTAQPEAQLWLPSDGDQTPNGKPDAALPAKTAYTPFGLEFQTWLQHYRYSIRQPQVSNGSLDTARQVIDLRHDFRISPRLTLHVSDRADFLIPLKSFASVEDPADAINSLREAYATVRFGNPATPLYLDAGRINIRNGVGSGYNPTDFFKQGAVLTATTRDPNALRTDRLGVVALRLQSLASWGAASVTYIPALQNRGSLVDIDRRRRGFGYLGLDRTNAADAVFVKLAPRISETVSVDLLALRDRGRTKLGTNVSTLLGNALVGNVEAALVQTRRLPGPGEGEPSVGWYALAAANLTWTLSQGLELTAEASYAGDALDGDQWRRYRTAIDAVTLAQLDRIVTDRSLRQEPLTRVNWFLRAAWRDAFRQNGLDVSGFATGNAYDNSLLWQVTVRQDFVGWSAGLLASGFSGRITSEYGASPLKSYLGVFVTKSF